VVTEQKIPFRQTSTDLKRVQMLCLVIVVAVYCCVVQKISVSVLGCNQAVAKIFVLLTFKGLIRQLNTI
jgi:hypothetical protein